MLPKALTVQITVDQLERPEVAALLAEHLADMHRFSPPESIHALDLDELRAPEITFWTAWEQGDLLGCAALRELDGEHGEIKSMHTARAHRRRGVGTRLLEHLIGEARRRGYRRLSLETGSGPAFDAAHAFFRRFGFEYCGPFGDYRNDAFSRFMTRALGGGSP